MVVNYGFAVVEAENESEAIQSVSQMDKRDFDWSDDWSSQDAEVVETIEKGEME